MPRKSSSKKQHKVDPIVRLAEKNRQASLTAMESEHGRPTSNKRNKEQESQDLELDRFFKEMKHREF